MKVLTISSSPYLLTKLGRINSSILKRLSKTLPFDNIASIVWHHDISWFAPNDDNEFIFEDGGDAICKLYPIPKSPEQATPNVYDVIKSYQPDVVVTIGDYHETDFLFALKTLNPKMFKWISILTIDAYPVNETRKDAFNYINKAIATTKMGQKAVNDLSRVDCEYLPFGPDQIFQPKVCEKNKDFLTVFGCGKNSQASGSATYIMGLSEAYKKDNDIKGYMHTNVSDRGDYDLSYLAERYGIKDNLIFPDEFVGLNDGIDRDLLRSRYAASDVVSDLSVRSATGLCLLEGMACGCIPIATEVGALKEIISLMPKDFQFFVGSNTYVGSFEEEYEVANCKDFARILLKLKDIKENNPNMFDSMRKSSIKVANKFKLKTFTKRIEEIIMEVIDIEEELVLEVYEN